MKVIIPGRLDGMNTYIDKCRSHKYQGYKMKEENQNICKCEIKRQLKGLQIDKPVRLHFSWYEPNRKRDKDNISSFGRKVIQDALVDCGVLKNDGWKNVVGFTDEFHVDKQKPRIEIEIEVIGS